MSCTSLRSFVSCKSMQKQHLQYFLLISLCCLGAGCGEPKFRTLNPYLHGQQELNIALPDSELTPVLIDGWEFLPFATLGFSSGGLKIITPDSHFVNIDWLKAGTEEPVLFNERIRHVRGLTVTNSALGLTLSIEVSPTGRSLSVELDGVSVTALEARLSIATGGVTARGLAALTETWTTGKNGADIALPWGDQWKLKTDAEVTPRPKSDNTVSATLSYGDDKHRELTLDWSPFPSNRGSRGLDIKTESMSADEALALLISSIPPVHQIVPSDQERLEHAAEITEAQWLVHAEYTPNYLNDLEVGADQTYLLSYALPAYLTLYTWGPIAKKTVWDKEPMLDAAMSRFDTTSHEIRRGASLENRLREATVWTFAEEHLATDRPEFRKTYREQAVVALDDVRRELKHRFRLWRRENSVQRDDTLAFFEMFVGGDSAFTEDEEPFIPPDTLQLLRIAARGSLSWLESVTPDWVNVMWLPWPEEMDRLRWKFDSGIKFRSSNHWQIAQNALLDNGHPGIMLPEQFKSAPISTAAAEISTVTKSYLGIRPQWREATITFDPRLPENWGRTRARMPFEQGELYVDYDLANNQAWVAARGLTQAYTCQFYMPTPSGALSAQFKLEQGDSPRKVTLVLEPGNKYRIRFESSSLPE